MNAKSEIAAFETLMKMVKLIIVSKISDYDMPSGDDILHKFFQTQE